MNDCIFCRIASGDIPSQKVYEDDLTFAFRDINPQARVHVVVIPKRHASCLNNHAQLSDAELAACLRACQRAAQAEGIDIAGFRVISNCGKDARQSVGHLHFHVLGGQKLGVGMA